MVCIVKKIFVFVNFKFIVYNGINVLIVLNIIDVIIMIILLFNNFLFLKNCVKIVIVLNGIFLILFDVLGFCLVKVMW